MFSIEDLERELVDQKVIFPKDKIPEENYGYSKYGVCTVKAIWFRGGEPSKVEIVATLTSEQGTDLSEVWLYSTNSIDHDNMWSEALFEIVPSKSLEEDLMSILFD